MIEIRNPLPTDLPALVAIDNYYIQNSYCTFDTDPRTVEERTKWFNSYKTTGPYRLLVATENGKVVGCCSSNKYRDHKAFEKTIEVSIYLAPECRSKGVGSLLYQKLFSDLKDEPLHLAVAGIALPNEASVSLHKKFGFTEVGVFNEYAVKNGAYINSMWLQKKLNP